MKLYLNESKARHRFKELLGQANHFIITALVGLDAIEKGIVTEGPPDLHAVWSPQSPVVSARRSRILILDMALVRAVDALDLYIRLSRRKPYLAQAPELQTAIDDAKNSVLKKLRAMAHHHQGLNRTLAALMEVMIAWRNRRVHSLDDEEVNDAVWNVIRGDAKWIESEFRGLDVERLLKDFDEQHPPKFRETTSLIRATQKTVEELETIAFSGLAADVFLKELIWTDFDKDYHGHGTKDAHRRRRIAGIWGRDASDKERAVQGFLMNLGLSDQRRDQTAIEFDDSLLSQISRMVPLEVYDFLTPAGN
jgi:hypothetical protein